MRTFYIATGLGRTEDQKALASKLEKLGFSQTYNWAAHGSAQDRGPEGIRDVALAELAGVKEADLFIVLLPGERGTHTELGIALADSIERGAYQSPKTILIVGETEDAAGNTCAFYLHPRVDERFTTVGELLAWLKSWRRSNPLPQEVRS